MPIPPVTSTVVRKIGEIPFVPATIGAILTNGTYGLPGFPVPVSYTHLTLPTKA